MNADTIAIIAAGTALVGAVAAMLTALNNVRSRQHVEVVDTYQSYVDLVKTLQEEVTRLNAENVASRSEEMRLREELRALRRAIQYRGANGDEHA